MAERETNRIVNVAGDVVKIVAQRTTHTKLAVTALFDVTFDYAGVSRDDMLRLATRSTLITLQRQMRDSRDKPTFLGYNRRTYKVMEMLANEKRGLPPVAKVERILDGMEKADAIALLEERLKAIKGKQA